MDHPGQLLSVISSGRLTGFLVAIIALLLCSAFFSSTETAYTSLNRIRLKNMEQNGKRRTSKRAGLVLRQLEKYDKFLSTVLIGNNIVNITMSSLGTIMFVELLSGKSYATAVSTAVLTITVLIFGEVTPKSLAKAYPERMAMLAAPVISVLSVIFTPLSALFTLFGKLFKVEKASSFSGEELLTIVEEAENDGEIDEHESELIRSAIEFDDVDVYDIMVPRVDVIAVDDTSTMDEIAQKFETNGFSRMPVYHETIDSIVGVIHIKDFYELHKKGGKELSPILQDNLCVSKNMRISAALRLFQKSKVHLAVVVDEFGGTSGIVTLEDILEELVGEIYDEHDEIEILLRKETDDTYMVSGSYSLDELGSELDMSFDDFTSSTVGGWVTELTKSIPVIGEVITYRNLEITVTKATSRRITELKIIVGELNEDEDDDEKEQEE